MIGKFREFSSNDWKIPVLALGLFVFAILLFAPATQFDFIQLDDNAYIVNNPHVTTGLSSENIRWAFTTAHEQWYLPMLWLSFMADAHFFGVNPGAFHRTNVFLHAVNVLLLFLVLVRMTGSVWRSVFVAALFAAHPTRVEAVAWITARKDNLSGLFFMLGLWTYVGYVERKAPWRMVLLVVWLWLGLLAKAVLVVFPVCLLLLDYWPLRRVSGPLEGHASARPGSRGSVTLQAWKPLVLEKLPLFGLSALFAMITLSTHEVGRGDFAGVPYFDRLSFIAPNVWQYVALVFAPRDLAVVYPERDVWNGPLSLAALAGLLAVTYAAWRFRRPAPYLIVGWLWFLVALAPILRGVRLGLASHADRFTYLPLIGLALALTWAVADALPRRNWRTPVLTVVAAGLLIGCWTGARAYLPYWRDSETLFLRALERTEDNYLIFVNLAATYSEQGRIEEEMAALREALRINPRSAVSHVGMGAALRALGRYDEAAAHFLEAARHVPPREWQVHVRIGEHFALTAQFDDAIRHFEQVLRVNPDYIAAYHNIGICHLYRRRFEQALPYFDEVIRRNPEHLTARSGRARALAGLGRLDEALEEAQRSGREEVVREIKMLKEEE